MMNIYDLARRSNLPLKALRKLEKLNVLKIEKENDIMSKLLFQMKSNVRFTMPQLFLMLNDPEILKDLRCESERYAKRAEAQLAEIGDVALGAAPAFVTAEIRSAGKGDNEAARVIAVWLMDVLPIDPVSYAWIAARILYSLDEFSRSQVQPMLSLAMLGVRGLPEFSGYWRSEKIGARNTIKYFQKKVGGWNL